MATITIQDLQVILTQPLNQRLVVGQARHVRTRAVWSGLRHVYPALSRSGDRPRIPHQTLSDR